MDASRTEISFRATPRPEARYVSGMSVHEEALSDTRWLELYRSASGQIQDLHRAAGLPGLNPLEYPLHAFDLELDGQDLRNGWEHVASVERPGARPGTREAVVTLRHLARPVTLKVVTRLDGSPFFVRYLEITNTAKVPAALSRVSPLSGLLFNWRPNDHWGDQPVAHPAPFTLGYFDGPVSGTEGNFKWEPLPRGSRRIESNSGHSGFGNPVFMVRNELTGEMAVGALAWSGNWSAEFWRDPHLDLAGNPSRGVRLGFRMGPRGPAPQRVLAPGETVLSPETHLAILHGSFDDAVGALHGHLRASVIPARPKGREFFSVAGRVVEQPGEWILREIDIAAEMGLGAFMIDAGWYGDEFGPWWDKRGDWTEGKWLPGGLAACRERCHKHGMLFGLWMEPEAVGPKSQALREHPDWLLRSFGGKPMEQLMLDLSHPDAAKFMRESVLRVIREHRPDFFKIDYNKRVFEGGQRLRDGYVESELWRHCEALYEVFDEARRTMPDVALECCASGGGRNDLGMLSRFHYACESDFSVFPRGIRAINGLTLFLPPEALCYYHNLLPGAHQKADIDTHLRVTLFAQPTFVGFGAQDADRSTPYFEKTRRYIKLSRDFVRPIMMARPRVWHHTPDIGVQGPADWCVLEYSASDRGAGYAGLFRLAADAPREYLFRPRGLDAARRYAVTLDNSGAVIERTGGELMIHGLPVRLDAVNTSELLMFKALAE
jgi:alpha-galactosidase